MPRSRRDPLCTCIKTQVALLVLAGSTAKMLEVWLRGAEFKDVLQRPGGLAGKNDGDLRRGLPPADP